MKKWLLYLLVLFVPSIAKADLFELQEDRSYHIYYTTTVPAGSSSANVLLIHLSSGTNTGIFTEWPHSETGEITISHIRIEIDKVAASTCAVKLGVLTAVNLSSGSVSWFANKNYLLNVSNTSTERDTFPTNTIYRLRVNPATINTAGTTPYIITNDKIGLSDAGSTSFQTDVLLPSVASTGLTLPQTGDAVMNISKTSGAAVTVTVELKYYTRRR